MFSRVWGWEGTNLFFPVDGRVSYEQFLHAGFLFVAVLLDETAHFQHSARHTLKQF